MHIAEMYCILFFFILARHLHLINTLLPFKHLGVVFIKHFYTRFTQLPTPPHDSHVVLIENINCVNHAQSIEKSLLSLTSP